MKVPPIVKNIATMAVASALAIAFVVPLLLKFSGPLRQKLGV